MRKVIIFGCVAVAVTLGAICLRATNEPASYEDSPAFGALLSQAIDRLEGIPRQVTAVSVSEARAESQQPTVSDYTCGGFRTCDGILTCDGTETCNGEETCWASTCLTAPTCEATCSQYTVQGGETCDGSATCTEACPGWPTYFAGWPTCTGEATCELTCPGYVSCSGCNATECTTWGRIKAEFGK
jgi:hypothetical protein